MRGGRIFKRGKHVLTSAALMAGGTLLAIGGAAGPGHAACTPGDTGTLGNDTIICDIANQPDIDPNGLPGNDTITIDGITTLSDGSTPFDVNAGEGDDQIILRNGAVVENVFASDGSDQIIFDGGRVNSTAVWGGGDDTQIITNIDIGGSANFAAGADVMTIQSGTVGANVVLGAAADTDSDTFTLEGGAILGAISSDAGADTINLLGGTVGSTVQGNDGDDIITLNGASTIVGGISGGNGVDTINLIQGTVNTSVDWGAGDETGVIDLTNVTITQDLILGAGQDDFEFIAGALGRDVQMGSAGAATTDADMFTLTDGTIGGVISGDAGQDTINLNGGTVSEGVTGREGDDIITLNGTSVDGVISGGEGIDTINAISGSAQDLNWGAGDETVTLDLSGVTINRNIIMGEGQDDFSLTDGTVGSNVIMGNSGAGTTDADTFTLAGGTVGDGSNPSSGRIIGDLGADTINLNSGLVRGFVAPGEGADTVILDDDATNAGQTVRVQEIRGGDGVDDIQLISGTVDRSVNWGAGDETATLDLTNVDLGIHIIMGEGQDDFTLTAGTVGGDVFLGNVARNTTDDDTFTLDGGTINRSIRGDNGVDTINLISGSTTGVNWGGGDETATLDLTNVTITRDIVMGAGNDTFELTAGTVGRDVRLGENTATVGTDVFTLTDGVINRNILGDAGQDTVNVDGGAVGGGVFAADGDDIFNWTGGSIGRFEGGAGADTATVSISDATLFSILNGGSDGAADTSSDRLILDGMAATVTGSAIGGWEEVSTLNSTLVFDTLLLNGVQSTVIDPNNAATTLNVDGGDVTLAGASVLTDLQGSANAEVVAITGATAMTGTLDVGGGDDTVTLASTGFTGDADGGAGEDLLVWNIAEDRTSDPSNLQNFETLQKENANALRLTGPQVFATATRVNAGTLGVDGTLETPVVTLADDTTLSVNGTLQAVAGGQTALTGSSGQNSVEISTGGTLLGNGDLGDGADTVNLAGALDTGGGTLNLGAGNDTLQVLGGASLSGMVDGGDGASDQVVFDGFSGAIDGAALQNWELINITNGTVDLGAGITAGAGPGLGLVVGAGGTVQNTADFAVTGDVSILSGGSLINQVVGTSMIDITGDLRNAGRISMADGGVGDSITVSGNYTGGGAIELDVDFATDTADVLIIGGDVLAGGSTLFVTDISTGPASGQNILLVDVTGSTLPGDFALDGGVISTGALSYGLSLEGSQWFLIPLLLPQNIVYEAYPRTLLALNLMDSHQERMQSRFWLSKARDGGVKNGVWFKASTGRNDLSPSFSTSADDLGTDDIDYEIDLDKIETGIDFFAESYGASSVVAGARLFYGKASLAASSPFITGDISSKAVGVGASLTWYSGTGAYVDAQLQYADFDSDLSTETGNLTSNNDGYGFAASLEGGQRFELSDAYSVTTEAQYSFYDVGFDEFTSDTGEVVSLEDGSTSELRLGGTLEYRAGADALRDSRLFVTANVFHTFDTTTSVDVASSSLINEIRPWRGEIGVGGSHEWVGTGGSRMAVYADVTAGSDLGSAWSSGRTLSGRIGFKMEF